MSGRYALSSVPCISFLAKYQFGASSSNETVMCNCVAPGPEHFERKYVDVGKLKKLLSSFPAKSDEGNHSTQSGSSNGLLYSTTVFLDFQLGWQGICIEHNKEDFEQLQVCVSHVVCVCVCVCV
jgi:hypothetical protein